MSTVPSVSDRRKARPTRKRESMVIAEELASIPEDQQQLLIYAQELNSLHKQWRRQFQELHQLYGDLQVKDQQRAFLLTQLLSAQEQERGRIARDIHDGPLQDLGVLLLSVERCKRQIEAGRSVEALQALAGLRQDTQQTISTLRALVNDLRPSVLDTYGLLGALDYLAGRFGRETQITIAVSTQIGARLDPNQEVIIFRLVQEALTNIRKHAQASHAWVTLQRRSGDLYMEVRDDGTGFDVDHRMRDAMAGGHVGLASMVERAEFAGGRLTIESTPEQGTVVRFVLPLSATATADPPVRDLPA